MIHFATSMCGENRIWPVPFGWARESGTNTFFLKPISPSHPYA